MKSKILVVILVLMVFINPFNLNPVLASPRIIIDPPSAPRGTIITITGTGFVPGASGEVFYFEFVPGGIVPVTVDVNGAFKVTMIVPAVITPGVYRIVADIPRGGLFEASTVFLIEAFIITPKSAAPGDKITIFGEGFETNRKGRVGFDISGFGATPIVEVTTTNIGTFETILTVPYVLGCKTYAIFTDIPLKGKSGFYIQSFHILRILTTSPARGSYEDEITVTGRGFERSASGRIWFDTNGNGVFDAGEPAFLVSTDSLGFIQATKLRIPLIAGGSYFIRADIPEGEKVEESLLFTVLSPPSPKITSNVSPASIIRGSPATLTWPVTYATKLSISPDIGFVSPIGSLQVSPSKTTTYTFTATGPEETATFNVTLIVTETPTTTLVFTIGKSDYQVNGQRRNMDVAPVVIDGRTLLPIRYVAEPLGADVKWDGTTKKVTIILGTTTIELWIGKSIAKVNRKDTPIDSTNNKVVPILKDGRTLLPLRFVSENLGADVLWDGVLKTVTVRYPK